MLLYSVSMTTRTTSAIIALSLLASPVAAFAQTTEAGQALRESASSRAAARLQELRNLRLGVSSQKPTSSQSAPSVNVLSRRLLRDRIARQRAERQKSVTRSSPRSTTPGRPVTSPADRVTNPTFDPLTDTTVRSDLLLLNQVTPILAGIRVFSNAEPLDVSEVQIDLTSDVASVSQMLVYDETGRFLATATRRSAGTYLATFPTGLLQLPYRKEVSLYVRARLKEKDGGGVSGEVLQVDDVTVRGDGAWSNETRATTSDETFRPFETARARIVKIENADPAESILTAGSDQRLAAFRFTAEESDASASARLTDLVFTLETFGGVSISNVQLRREGSNETFDCSNTSSTITCSSITPAFGDINTEPLVLRVYAEVSLPVSTNDMFLRVTLNQAGTPTEDGAITWTDGSASFGWVGLDTPVVRGTSNER